MENIIAQFDYLTPEDGAALNALQSVVVFEIEDPAPQEPRTFTLESYASSLEDLSGPGLDEYCERCSRPNPKRKVRRNNQ
jgi:hypothetical protein